MTPRWSGRAAASLWLALAIRWFDAGAPFRPGWLAAIPPLALALPALAAAALFLRGGWREVFGLEAPSARAGLLLVIGATALFRLPLAVRGAEGYTTADAALSGIVAERIRDGEAHDVFVPSVPYSGSLKSHLTVPLAAVFGMARAFCLASLLFYSLFAAGAYRLGLRLGGSRTALAAGMWAAFSPAFVTAYSLSNDGNYVEVLALGTWALLLASRYEQEPARRSDLSLWAGLLLGLAFWCHILAVVHLTVVALVLTLVDRLRAWRPLARLVLGFGLGYLPGLLWNAGHEWASFQYLVPGRYWAGAGHAGPAPGAPAAAPGLLERLVLTARDHGPVLFGYDPGYPAWLDVASRALALAGLLAFCLAVAGAAARAARERRFGVDAVLCLFSGANLAAAVVALPHVAGNPRYLLFLAAPAAVLLGRACERGWRRALLAALIAFGALGSLGQAQAKLRSAAEWRRLVAALEREGVRYCYTDFYLAAPITFFSEQRVLCSSRLGPTTTEYFPGFRERVDEAPAPAIVAVNRHSAARMERRLRALGVGFERLDLMKPVLLRLSRKVDPRELFPGRDFSPR